MLKELHITLQEDQTIRTFAIYQKFLTLKIIIVGNGKIYFFVHPAYFSKDFWEIYI